MRKPVFLFCIISILSLKLFAQEASGVIWIKQAYNSKFGRNPTAMEFNILNYNNGHWNNYSELLQYINEFQQNLSSSGISFKYSQKINNKQVIVGIFQNGTQIAANLINLDGGSIVAQGGENIISTTSGGFVSETGGNIVTLDGGNIAIFLSTKGANFGTANTIAENGLIVIKTSGSGAMIIQ